VAVTLSGLTWRGFHELDEYSAGVLGVHEVDPASRLFPPRRLVEKSHSLSRSWVQAASMSATRYAICWIPGPFLSMNLAIVDCSLSGASSCTAGRRRLPGRSAWPPEHPALVDLDVGRDQAEGVRVNHWIAASRIGNRDPTWSIAVHYTAQLVHVRNVTDRTVRMCRSSPGRRAFPQVSSGQPTAVAVAGGCVTQS